MSLGSSPPPTAIRLPPPNWDPSAPPPCNLLPLCTATDVQQEEASTNNSQTSSFMSGDGPFCGIQSKTSKVEQFFPLREVPMGGAAGGVGFVNAPLTASEVRRFKKALGKLVEDPIGISHQVDQFLRPNIYTWGEMNFILNILFSPEEVQMIQTAGMRIWERENRLGPTRDHKMPLVDPNWDPNQEEGWRNMEDYRSLMVKGIKESVPRGTLS
ncbi:hypothetical protein DUI87_30752 [Hirundo rustica rustica]|uniref:Uncharacterized protein n=1 Tax=Hirundo rustica rustica TaxID=333673 RepID=A0A3M0IWM3_HIRRU|nr:hypothetical protein DUI87_30752 [Hirundo rustica rustica]